MVKPFSLIELKQIELKFVDKFVFSFARDLSTPIEITTYPNYTQEELASAVTSFVIEYVYNYEPRVKRFIGFANVTYKIQ